MSGEAIKAWVNRVTKDDLLRAQNTMPPKRRPKVQHLELVGKHLSESLKDARGFVDETLEQIRESLHDVLSIDQLGDCLQALHKGDLWVVVRVGAPGRGTRRVFALYDPKDLLERRGADPLTMDRERRGKHTPTQGENDATQGENDPTQGGNPLAPKKEPKKEPKKNPTPSGATQGELIADRVAQIALRLDQERHGKITTPRLLRTRTSDYKFAALKYLQQQLDLDAIDDASLAAHLVSQRDNAGGNTMPPPVQSPPPKHLAPPDGDPDCEHCAGDGYGFILNEYNERKPRNCVCIGGSWAGQEFDDSAAPSLSLEERVENDQMFRELRNQLRDHFTMPPG